MASLDASDIAPSLVGVAGEVCGPAELADGVCVVRAERGKTRAATAGKGTFSMRVQARFVAIDTAAERSGSRRRTAIPPTTMTARVAQKTRAFRTGWAGVV